MVIAKLHFVKSLALYDTQKPYFLNLLDKEGSQNVPSTNLEYSQYDGIDIDDIRRYGKEAFSLSKNGFEVLENYSRFSNQLTTTEIETYCHNIVDLISRKYNAAHTLCYDYRIRESSKAILDYEIGFNADNRTTTAPPVLPAHIDHTVDGGWQRVRRHLTEEETRLYLGDQYRIQIINVWRPIWNTVEDMPLAICDPRTIDTNDLLAADRVSRDFVVEMYYLKHNQRQKWYWLSRQTTSELLTFVNYDSECRLDGSNWMCCPHAAFVNAEAVDGAPLRASIELRLIVLTSVTVTEK